MCVCISIVFLFETFLWYIHPGGGHGDPLQNLTWWIPWTEAPGSPWVYKELATIEATEHESIVDTYLQSNIDGQKKRCLKEKIWIFGQKKTILSDITLNTLTKMGIRYLEIGLVIYIRFFWGKIKQLHFCF